MKLHTTDISQISKRNCETKDCPNKAAAIFKRKFLCKQCYSKEKPNKNDKKVITFRGLFKYQ